MTPLQRKSLMFFTANGLILTALCVIGGLLFHYGPELEPQFLPIVRFGPTDSFYRDPDKVCWLLHARKVSWAADPHYEFYGEPEQGPDIPTGAYLVDASLDELPDQKMKAHSAGSPFERHYCFKIADRFPDVQRIRILGHVEHRRHPFWTTVTPVPPFVICPLGQRQDGRCGAS